MSNPQTPPRHESIAEVASYHAHVYYDPAASRHSAELLRGWIAERFSVQMGRWHDTLVGPHSQAMYQVAFSTELFGRFVPWLMLNRLGLTVLVHPNTGSPRADHLIHSLWLGAVLPLDAQALPVSSGPGEESPVVPNTRPGPQRA